MLFLWAVYSSEVPEGVLGSSSSNVGGLYSFFSQNTASSSVVVTEVEPFDRSTPGPARIHTDSLHRCIPNRMRCLPRRGNSVRGVGRLSFRRTHTSSGNEGSSTVIETLPVVVYLQNQGGTHSFSLHLLCREIILLCDGPQTVLTVRHVPGNLNLIANALSRFRVPVNTNWELHPVIFSSYHSDMGSPPDRSVCHQFEIQTGDIQPECLGRGCNDHDYKLCYLNVIMVAYLLL